MAGPAGMPPLLVPLTTLPADAFLIRPGQTVQATVQGAPGRLFIQVAGTQVALESNTPLQPGQSVLVEVMRSGNALQLRVTPRESVPVPTVPVAPPATDELVQVLARVLEALGSTRPPDVVSRLLPPQLPPSETAVRQLVSLFITRGALGQDLQLISTLVSHAAAAGAVPQEVAQRLLAVIAGSVVADPAQIEKTLQSRARQAARSLEGNLARATRAQDVAAALREVTESLREQIARLREEPTLLRFLQRAGRTQDFDRAVDRILERLAGSDIQHLRALQAPYAFVEVPLSAESPLQHVQVHFFGKEGGKRAFDAKNASVALDVSTTRLGDLWITLTIVRGHCNCAFRATDESVVQAIRENAPDLVQALENTGYRRPVVHAALWDGDRLNAVAALMGGLSGLDLKV